MARVRQFITMRLDGIPGFQDKLRKLGKQTPQAVGAALLTEGNSIFADSQHVVPVKTGTLRSSGFVYGPYKNDSGNPEVLLAYGGAAKKYALEVHENLAMQHADPTSSKYLEGPFIAHMRGIDVRLGIEAAQEMKRRGWGGG